jgi:predicted phosphodiesterase
MDSATNRDLGLLEGPLLIFGGPYGNLPATTAFRTLAEQRGIPPEHIICTGDLVAYCAEPDETVCLLLDWGIQIIMGNCEQSLANRAIDCGCGFETGSPCSALSTQWFRYADKEISDVNRLWMSKLPQTLTFKLAGRQLAVVHGGVSQINRFLFASTSAADKLDELNLVVPGIDGLIAGHCGIPFGQIVSGKAWLNAGVIGMPANDGTQDGWYLLIEADGEQLKAHWHRLSYPAGLTRQTMLKAGLTSGYADTIISGLWPSEDVLPAAEKRNRGKTLNLPPIIF